MSAVEFPKEIHLMLLLHSNILLPYFHRKCGRCAVSLLLLLRAIASLASTTECRLSKTTKHYSKDKEEDFVIFYLWNNCLNTMKMSQNTFNLNPENER